VVFYRYVSFYLCMCRPMCISIGFTSCICPTFYAAILLINIFELNLNTVNRVEQLNTQNCHDDSVLYRCIVAAVLTAAVIAVAVCC